MNKKRLAMERLGQEMQMLEDMRFKEQFPLKFFEILEKTLFQSKEKVSETILEQTRYFT
jgi:hypothetical protein